MTLSLILVGVGLVLVAFIAYIRHEFAKVQKASVELYFVLSFEPLLADEVYEMARHSGLSHLTQFLKGTPLTKCLYRFASPMRSSYDPWFYYEHLNLLIGMLEDCGLAKVTRVPVTLAWLELNQARLWAVPPERMEYWTEWAQLMQQLDSLANTEERRPIYRRYEKKWPTAEMVQKRPWGRKTPPKEVRLTERSWQGA